MLNGENTVTSEVRARRLLSGGVRCALAGRDVALLSIIFAVFIPQIRWAVLVAFAVPFVIGGVLFIRGLRDLRAAGQRRAGYVWWCCLIAFVLGVSGVVLSHMRETGVATQAYLVMLLTGITGMMVWLLYVAGTIDGVTRSRSTARAGAASIAGMLLGLPGLTALLVFCGAEGCPRLLEVVGGVSGILWMIAFLGSWCVLEEFASFLECKRTLGDAGDGTD